MEVKGQVISGEFANILIRQKSASNIELGELLVIEDGKEKMILQVFDLLYGSQISQQNLELISGMELEENTQMKMMDAQIRNYVMAKVKNLVTVRGKSARVCKALPKFFSKVRKITEDDLSFITKPNNPLLIGNLRSGAEILETQIYLEGDEVFSHHILIPATTGRGKSNLMSVILWDALPAEYCGMLVLDPHDEYYGRNRLGLKDHPQRDRVVYYTYKNPPPGTRTLRINVQNIRPAHLSGVLNLSDPQIQCMQMYHKKYQERWVEAALLEKPLDAQFHEGTIAVMKRRLLSLLDIGFAEDRFVCNGIFDFNIGQSTVKDIMNELEKSKTVIIDTSNFSGAVELLVGSLIAHEIFRTYKNYKIIGTLPEKPVISIVLEEAPRVLGKEVLERGPNIFDTIAREGRKFKVGLTAITQLPSLIPRQILANMNTKIILGIEMAPERQAIIESAAQDLSTDNRNIASLDKGEAIVSSNFARFALPIKIPLFSTFAKKDIEKYLSNPNTSAKPAFSGIKS